MFVDTRQRERKHDSLRLKGLFYCAKRKNSGNKDEFEF